MLSSVLNSERAIQVNIAIMRTFVRLREPEPGVRSGIFSFSERVISRLLPQGGQVWKM
jgi:hypothetical protein